MDKLKFDWKELKSPPITVAISDLGSVGWLFLQKTAPELYKEIKHLEPEVTVSDRREKGDETCR